MQNTRAVELMRPTVEVIAKKFAAQAPRPANVDTRDLEQDAYVAVLQALPRWDGSTKISTFMRRRVFGSMIDGLRRWNLRSRRPEIGYRIRWESLPDDADERWTASTPTPEQLYLRHELQQAIDRLDARSQRILQLYYVDGLTLEQIGSIIGVNKSRTAVLRQDALRQLREILSWPTPITARPVTGISPRTAPSAPRSA